MLVMEIWVVEFSKGRYNIRMIFPKNQHTVFPHIRPAGIIIIHSLQMQVLLENTTLIQWCAD